MKIVIYGAKALALGIYNAVRELYPQYFIPCFIVSSLQDNPSTLAGLPVRQIAEFSGGMDREQRGISVS